MLMYVLAFDRDDGSVVAHKAVSKCNMLSVLIHPVALRVGL